MKKVLIALDYGLSAQEVADKGHELAKGLNAQTTLIHVIAEESYYSSIDSAPFIGFYGYDFFDMVNSDNLIDSSMKFLEKIKQNLKDSSIEKIAIQGDFATAILETANNNHFDVIVIGSNSKNWLEKTVMGSVTESVFSKTKIPLLIIPIKEKK